MSALRDRAESAKEAGNFREAYRLWSELASETRDATDYCQVGWAAYELEKWSEAEIAYGQALDIDPECAFAMEGLGRLFQESTDGDRRANLLLAKDWYLRALEIERNARRLFFLGTAYGLLKDVAAARDAFLEAVALRPDYEEAYLNLALLNMYECNNPQRAREYLGKALQIDPQYADAYFHLALLDEDENPQETRSLLEKAVEFDPNHSEALFKLAMLNEGQNGFVNLVWPLLII